MSIKQSDYEIKLSEYSNRDGAIALLREYRPYLEMIPSLRRPDESVISIPLPIVKIRQPKLTNKNTSINNQRQCVCLPCDLAILMCDPEWKIKMGGEILIFIHRPDEDFSDLLTRWRQTQMFLHQEYEWLMSPGDEHIFSEGTQKLYPLFVVFKDTLHRIKRGLKGANLPFVIQQANNLVELDKESNFPSFQDPQNSHPE